MALELTWSIIPLLIAMVMFVWAPSIFYRTEPHRLTPEISVIGKQWMWKIQHQDGRREINELHVPIGSHIVLEMTSQDVIHDFAIPAFRVKQDVIPGATHASGSSPPRSANITSSAINTAAPTTPS